jgi:glycosyltransferase involved in cell wall biosynthesis
MNHSVEQNAKTPLVTIAVPTLNGADYLRETLMSLLTQDYPALDILLSDNGSTDGSLSLASAVAQDDPRVRFRRNEVTVPIHEHYNQCLEAVRGEFFVLLDDDDLISPNFVSRLVQVAVRHPHLDIVIPRNETIDINGITLQEYSVPDDEVVDGFQFVCDWLYCRTLPKFACVSAVLLRTASIRGFGGYQGFERGQNIDNLLLLQCAVGNQIGFAADAIFKWRVYHSSYGGNLHLQVLMTSSRQFVRHVQRDPRTVAVLSKLSPAQRREIIDGVRYLGAQDVLNRMNFFGDPYSLVTLRRLIAFRMTSMCYRLVFGHYLGKLRDRIVMPIISMARADRS